MAQTLFYVPANSTTWTNQGTGGSSYNATASTTSLYHVQSNGYPYWGDIGQANYVCIPAGATTNNQSTVSWEIGFHFTGTTARSFQKIWDKAVGGYMVYLNTSAPGGTTLTLSRSTTGGTTQNWYEPTNTRFTPGNDYYIQIAWTAGTNPASAPHPTIYIGVNGTAPVLQTTYDDTGPAQGGTGSWYNDSVGTANIGNYSANTSCPYSSQDYWLNGRIYVFRQYNTNEATYFSSGGSWNTDKARWSASTPQTSVLYLGNAPGSSSFPTTGTTITNKGSSGSSYNGTAHANTSPVRYATLGAYTQWVFSGVADTLTIPSGTYTDNLSSVTFEFGIYYIGSGSGSNAGMLFFKESVEGIFYALIEDTTGIIEIGRTCTDASDDKWRFQTYLAGGHWYDIEITWDMGSAPANRPHVYVNNSELVGYSNSSVGTAAWSSDSSYPIYIGNESALDQNLNVHIASFRLYNYIDAATRAANYTADSARWAGANTPISSAETVTLHLTETQTPESSGTTTYRSQNEVVTLATTETSMASLPALDAETVTLVLTEDGVPDIHSPETVTPITTETQAINAVSAEYLALTITEITTPQTAFKPIINEIVYLEIIEGEWVCTV